VHSRIFCELSLDFSMRPSGPLLVKSGDEDALDPTLPDMQFVRTHDPASNRGIVFVPGSSLKGVVRSHAERLARSQDPYAACDPLKSEKTVTRGLRSSCSMGRGSHGSGSRNRHKQSGGEAYASVCYACRIFGSTAVASRVLFSDLMPEKGFKPILGERKSVAIDRVTGAVSAGPFEMEVVEDAIFRGNIGLRNFTIGQFGLVSGVLLDISDGLVPIGFGKSKGFGRVTLHFESLRLRYPVATDGQIWGVGNMAEESVLESYGLQMLAGRDFLPTPYGKESRRGLYMLSFVTDEEIRHVLDNAATKWPEEVGSQAWSGGRGDE